MPNYADQTLGLANYTGKFRKKVYTVKRLDTDTVDYIVRCVTVGCTA